MIFEMKRIIKNAKVFFVIENIFCINDIHPASFWYQGYTGNQQR